MAVTSAQIQELYIGYFGRPADQAGLNYWLTAGNNANSTTTLNDIRASFAQQQEYLVEYPATQTRADTVREIYVNLFGRQPADNEVGYWTYTSAATPTENLIQAFLEAASTSDRAVVNAKSAFAQTLTDAYGSSATTGTGTNSNIRVTYQQAIDAANADQQQPNKPAYIDSLNAAIATVSENLGYSFDAATNAGSYNAFGQTAGSLNIAATAALPETLNLSGNNLQSFTLAHNLGDKATASALAFGGDADQAITSLTLNLTHDAVTETAAAPSVADNVTVNVSTLAALTTLNAAGSNVDLSFTATVPSSVTNITLGSGDDVVNIATGTAADAKVVALATGAGNDVIGAEVGNANIQINAGAGNDQVNLSFNSANTVNHGAEIALGEGNDVLAVTGANVKFYAGSDAAKASQLAAAAVKVTDFAAGDSVSIATITATKGTADFSATDLATFNAATTLVGKLDAAAALLGSNTTSMHFEFNGNTYVYADTAGAGTFGAGDTLIELTGATGLANSSFAV